MKRLLIVAVLVLAAVAVYSVPKVIGGARAYVFGYPLVLMELTRRAMVYEQPENSFAHNQVFPDHNFREVVRPNNDTLYTSAWLNLAAGPVLLEVPDTAGRYFVIPLMDAWTNVFATIGKRSRGTGEGRYLLTGPGWEGAVPAGLVPVTAPTNMVWIIGRIQTNGRDDVAAVAELQQGFRLTGLDGSEAHSAAVTEANQLVQSKVDTDPYARIVQMSASEFLQLLAQLMVDQPPAAEDANYLAQLTGIGLLAGQRFEVEKLSALEAWLLDQGKKLAHNRVRAALESRELENGWAVARAGIGSYGTDYGARTGVAMIGLGALPTEEAIYPNAMLDGDGRPLSGDHSYRIHFPPGQTPPVDAFWSLTMYDGDGFLVDNPIGRYNLGDRDALHFNADGSLDILIQHTAPESPRANWLPAPPDRFAVTMRLYLPQASALDGGWQIPPLERLP